MAAAAAALPGIAESALTAANALGVGSMMFDKYKPKIKGSANHIFSKRKRKNALNYIKKLGTAKGLKKFVTKDAMKAAKGASKYVSSGKLLKSVGDIASDAGTLANVAHSTGMISDDTHKSIHSGIGKGQDAVSHYHQIAENYNEAGKDIHDSFKDALKPKPQNY